MPKLSLSKLERHLYGAADRLRQEGLDAATHKDYIFGLLFLKRCSDVFDGERERIVGRKAEQGVAKDDALARYGENPDYYDGFFGKPAERRGQVLFINADAEFYAGRAQNYLRPEHVEKIASTFERFEDVPGYARRVPIDEIGGPENDGNLNIRRYVDNSPPPEPHDVRAHLQGGVPATEVEAKRPLCEALGFDPVHAFVPREPLSPPGERGRGEGGYLDFAPALTDRAAIRPLIENDPGVLAKAQALRDALAAWWDEHSPRLADLPEHRQLNRVRAEFLDTFSAALLPLGTLDRVKLAGVIAAWWTDTLPDFKTLLENGFPGVVDGWVDAIADAVDDDEAAGPAFDPFGHKLVRRIMADYLEQIAAAKADIARLKGEKEAFEQANAPEDLDEEELEGWNQAKDLARRIKELKAELRNLLPPLARRGAHPVPPPLVGAGKGEGAPHRRGRPPTLPLTLEGGGDEVSEARRQVLAQLAALEADFAPFEQLKADLAAARTHYRELTGAFVDELKARCTGMGKEDKGALVLELFAQDVAGGLDAAVAEKRQELVGFVDRVWEKYRVTLADLREQRRGVEDGLGGFLQRLGFA